MLALLGASIALEQMEMLSACSGAFAVGMWMSAKGPITAYSPVNGCMCALNEGRIGRVLSWLHRRPSFVLEE